MSGQSPARPSVLIVEDEWLIAALLSDEVGAAGYKIVGPVGSAADAMSLIATEPIDAALLDISIGTANSFPVADALAGRGVPFVFLTGYIRTDLPDAYQDVSILKKPFEPSLLREALETLLARNAAAVK